MKNKIFFFWLQQRALGLRHTGQKNIVLSIIWIVLACGFTWPMKIILEEHNLSCITTHFISISMPSLKLPLVKIISIACICNRLLIIIQPSKLSVTNDKDNEKRQIHIKNRCVDLDLYILDCIFFKSLL